MSVASSGSISDRLAGERRSDVGAAFWLFTTAVKRRFPALCSKLCSDRVGKRRIGTGQDRIGIGGSWPKTVRFGVIRGMLIGA